MNEVLELQNNFMDDNSMCDRIVRYFKKSNKRSLWQDDKFFSGRTLCPSEIEDVQLKNEIYSFQYKLIQRANKKYNKFIYPEFWDIVYWKTGMFMDQHVDNPKGLEQRHYTSITYLNSDYNGGETFLPDFEYNCVPKKGKTIMFPSNHLHGVKKVTRGSRYTLAMWYTTDPKYIQFPS